MTHGVPAVPVLRFDTTRLPTTAQFPGWAATIPAYEVQQRDAAEGFAAIAEAWLLGRLVLSMSTIPAVRLLRTPERVLADGGDQYSVVVNCRGEFRCHLGGWSLHVPPGHALVLDNAAPFVTESTAGDYLILLVPRDLLMHERLPDPLHGHCPPGAQGLLLGDYLRALHRSLPGLPADQLPRIVRATCDLLVACLAHEPTGPVRSRADIIGRARRHVDQHPTLRPSAVEMARALGLSRTQLYRAFAHVGGVERFVMLRRLARARQALEDPDARCGIAAIARDCGFRSAAHFSRAFRQRFGIAPKAMRERARSTRLAARPATPDDVTRTYVAWTSGPA